MSNEKTIKIDFSNWNQLRKLMKKHQEFPEMISGTNEEGEPTITSINEDNIVLETHQKNHWTRKDIFYDDGTTETLFERS